MNKPVEIIAERYLKILPHDAVQNPEGGVDKGHLVWMLIQIRDSNMSETKKNRWLGFVQGCLVKDGLLSIREERDSTREVFNGK